MTIEGIRGGVGITDGVRLVCGHICLGERLSCYAMLYLFSFVLDTLQGFSSRSRCHVKIHMTLSRSLLSDISRSGP